MLYSMDLAVIKWLTNNQDQQETLLKLVVWIGEYVFWNLLKSFCHVTEKAIGNALASIEQAIVNRGRQNHAAATRQEKERQDVVHQEGQVQKRQHRIVSQSIHVHERLLARDGHAVPILTVADLT